MNLNLDNLLEQKSYIEKLSEYIHVSPEEYNTIPALSYISYIDRDGSIKQGGFFIRYYTGQRPDEKRFLLKIGKTYKTLYPIFYHIFYKPQELFNKTGKTNHKKKQVQVLISKLAK